VKHVAMDINWGMTYAKSKLYGNGELHQYEEKMCSGRENCTRCMKGELHGEEEPHREENLLGEEDRTGRSCTRRENCNGKTMATELTQEGKLHEVTAGAR
jgi:hypothetical protein